jgi:hypothetical protein
MKGDVVLATAIASPEGLKATPLPAPPGSVAGSAYFVPNPDDDQG